MQEIKIFPELDIELTLDVPLLPVPLYGVHGRLEQGGLRESHGVFDALEDERLQLLQGVRAETGRGRGQRHRGRQGGRAWKFTNINEFSLIFKRGLLFLIHKPKRAAVSRRDQRWCRKVSAARVSRSDVLFL